MIITRTPFRLSLCGGSTDIPKYYLGSQRGGLCVGGSINKYSYISARFLPHFHGFKTRLVYSQLETVSDNKDIKHNVIRSVIKYLGMENDGLEILHSSDIPGKSGVGSSSAFTVGLINALSALKERPLLPYELADAAIHVEQNILSESVGSQDQTMSSYGGFGQIRFHPNGLINVLPLPIRQEKLEELESHLGLFYTGITRNSSEIAATYYPSLSETNDNNRQMVRFAEDAVKSILFHDWKKLGHIVGKSWELKKNLSGSVSTLTIDRFYDNAINLGAYGGKLIGAGGGGMLLIIADPQAMKRVKEVFEVNGLMHIPFRFEDSGSSIIHFNRDDIHANRPVTV